MKLFNIFIVAALANNFVLSRFLGVCPFLGVSKKTTSAAGMSVAVTFVMLVATIVTYPIYKYILYPKYTYMNTIVFILVIAATVQLVEFAVKKYSTKLYKALGIYLPLITTNCAVLGVALLNVEEMNNISEAVVNALGAGAGFSLAIILFSGVRMRIATNDIPKRFSGTPIALTAGSIMAVIFSGFKGIGG